MVKRIVSSVLDEFSLIRFDFQECNSRIHAIKALIHVKLIEMNSCVLESRNRHPEITHFMHMVVICEIIP